MTIEETGGLVAGQIDFREITLADKELADRYLLKYGGRSCQHAFASMYCLKEKYKDSVCEKDDWLYILRAGLCTDSERVYLFPMGDVEKKDELRYAVEQLLTDAHRYGKRLRFETITEEPAHLLEELFPGQFEITENRDYAEYIYRRERLETLAGKDLAKKRYYCNRFYREYENRFRVEPITGKNIPEILAFQGKWLEERLQTAAEPKSSQLKTENRAMVNCLNAFEALGLKGICMYVDDVLCGYSFGSLLSGNCMDVIAEKASMDILHIYQALSREFTLACCHAAEYVNKEEDLGDPGLREAKECYHPDILLRKYVAREK